MRFNICRRVIVGEETVVIPVSSCFRNRVNGCLKIADLERRALANSKVRFDSFAISEPVYFVSKIQRHTAVQPHRT
jgi:hypothetical protein